MRIKQNDTVLVKSGKSKGVESTVVKVLPNDSKVIVSGVNKVKKHVKPSKENKNAKMLEFEKPISVSSVSLVCPSCKKPVKVSIQRSDGKKQRVCKKCQKIIN